MELVLALQDETHLRVTCDDRDSHTADLLPLLLQNEQEARIIVDDPVAYGKKLYAVLFPPKTPAQEALAEMPERILLVTSEPLLDAIPWEYVYGPYGVDDPASPDYAENFLVLECPFVRALLPSSQRIEPPAIDQPLHIIAVPSNPLSDTLELLGIEAEWMRLKESLEQIPVAMTLERTTPPTLERVRQQVANQKGRVVHFMGHGGQDQQQGAVLCFEQDNGALQRVTAKEFVQRVRGTVFLVTLNACVSATPGPTSFHNLAAALVRQKTPYALGMHLNILDEDARTFSRAFYNELARGIPVEEALYQSRLTLTRSQRPWVVGVPVLYTALAKPAPGFVCQDGTPTVKDQSFSVDVSALPPIEGTFQGRIQDMITLGTELTDDQRPRILTILGTGGQGKTALARKAAERFAFAWPGGIWAIALDHLPTRATFVIALAQFLGIETQETLDLAPIERRVMARLNERRTLLVLDNAETLIEAVEAKSTDAFDLVIFVKKLLGTAACLLVTSRIPLGWDDEQTYELGGLSPKEGAVLFRQGAPQRRDKIDLLSAISLSRQLEGHPLALRLLASAFNEMSLSLSEFLQKTEERLQEAENKYLGLEHRHRKLYACIEISVRSLAPPLRSLLSGLWIFHAPFLADNAVVIFDPDTQETEWHPSLVRDQLHQLWQRSLLTRKMVITRDGTLQLYALLPTTRPYVERYLEQMYEHELLKKRLITTYLQIMEQVYAEVNRSTVLAKQMREDFEWISEILERETMTTGDKARYWFRWGWVMYRLGNSLSGLHLLERALEVVQGTDINLTLQIANNTALVYRATGHLQEALKLYEDALLIRRKDSNRAGEATTLNNMAGLYRGMGRSQDALEVYENALPIMREVDDLMGEAAILSGMASVYHSTGHPQEALEVYEAALSIMREIDDLAGEAAALNNMASVYRGIGHVQKALELYEDALPIMREVGNRAGEAATFNNMASVYHGMGRLQEALELYEDALPIMREVGNRAGEATTLNNIALIHHSMGHVQKALELCEDALPIMGEVGNRAGEATTLNNMAGLYRGMGRLQEALELYENALSIMREIDDRAGEATTLNNIALIHRSMGHVQKALELYENALSIMREIDDRAGEATTLSGIAGVYHGMGQPQEALKLYESVLPIRREVGDRTGEATTLNGLAHLYQSLQRYEDAVTAFEQSIKIEQQSAHRAGEIAGLIGLAFLLHRHLNRTSDAIIYLKQALQVFAKTELSHDAAGQTVEQVQQWLTMMQDATISDNTSPTMIQAIQEFINAEDWDTTRQVVETQHTVLFQAEVETIFEQNIELAKFRNEEYTVQLLKLYLTLLRECQKKGIEQAFEDLLNMMQPEEEPPPFDTELISKSIHALLGEPQEKMAHVQYLTTLSVETSDEQLKALLNVIQLALFEGDPSQLGQNLEGVYRQAWETILAGLAPSGGETV